MDSGESVGLSHRSLSQSVGHSPEVSEEQLLCPGGRDMGVFAGSSTCRADGQVPAGARCGW